jgi:hypothetical protein
MSDNVKCPVCGGSLALLGQLGPLLWFRCINCGLDQSCISNKEECDA